MLRALAIATFIMPVLAPVLAPSLANADGADPVLAKMLGSWTGEGERIHKASGNRTAIRAQVTSRWQEDRVVSVNEVQDGDRKYLKIYWVQSLGDGQYGFGGGSGETVSPPELRGRLEGEALIVDQSLSPDGSLSVHSETRFTEDGSEYLELFKQGDRVLSETRIRYRAPASSS